MQHPDASDHARHDAILIAGHAAGDLSDADHARAEALLAGCTACGELRRDLVAIAAATRSVPPPAALNRDLRLAPEQADRLRKGSWLRGLLRPFASASSPIRPMATAFTSLGLVGLVVGITFSSGAGLGAGAPEAAPGYGLGNGAAATEGAVEDDNRAEYGGAAAGPSGLPVQPVSRASGDAFVQSSTTPPGRTTTDAASEDPVARPAAPTAVAMRGDSEDGDAREGAVDAGARSAPPPPNPLIAGSLGLLGIGLLLFGLRIASRRLR